MKICGYTGEMEKRLNRLDESTRNETVMEMMLEETEITENQTLGEMFLRMISYITGIPLEIWQKRISEMSSEELALCEEKFLGEDVHNFVEV